jgi:hypothetical protein
MLLSRHQNAVQNRDMKIAKRSLENVSQFKCLGTTVTNQNLVQDEIKRRLNSVQNLQSCLLLSKNVKIRIYKTMILPVVDVSWCICYNPQNFGNLELSPRIPLAVSSVISLLVKDPHGYIPKYRGVQKNVLTL